MCALCGYNPRENGILRGASLLDIFGGFGNASSCSIVNSTFVLQDS
jgi:hypothetical protein